MFMERLPLKLDDGRKIILNDSKIVEEFYDLEFCLENMPFLDNLDFSKKVMFSHEIKSNNNIEGIIDDIDSIKSVVESKDLVHDSEKKLRISNLYKGYNYILNNTDINKDSLKDLYAILSKDLLETHELKEIGKYYRTETGLILNKGRLDDSMDVTMDPKFVEDFMDNLIEYVNINNSFDTKTGYFIKSMIAHFYFVCIHPYYDINGRTSRTMSMWYLLNNKCYPYIIFNRAIHNEFKGYDETIRECKYRADVTKFIKGMLVSVKKEFEKEFVINCISSNISYNLSTLEYQTLNYILTMKGLKTLLDFATHYNFNNDKRKISDIYSSMIEPLIDKNIINVLRYTDRCYDSTKHNFEFEINPKLIERDERILKYVK